MKVELPRMVRIGQWLVGARFTSGWLHVLTGRAVGAGAVVLDFIAGADPDIPLRPWPQVRFEVRPRGDHLTVFVLCGLGVQVQTSVRVTA